jgi:hypothetical protein
MDGLVLVLAVILNPRAKRRARRAEQTGGVETQRGCDGDGHGGVMPVIQQDREKDPAP